MRIQLKKKTKIRELFCAAFPDKYKQNGEPSENLNQYLMHLEKLGKAFYKVYQVCRNDYVIQHKDGHTISIPKEYIGHVKEN